MTDYEDMVRGTARDWFWARVVLIGGFVIAIAVAGYFAWQRHADIVAAQQQQAAALAQAAQQQQRPRESRADENAKAGMMFCAMELLNAKNMGIIPPFGQLASLSPKKTDKQGRYACTAATQVSKYEIQADLICRTLTDPKCVHLHSIKSDDGTVLYQSKD
jgi:type II secretory pathway pseudopilin PulG